MEIANKRRIQIGWLPILFLYTYVCACLGKTEQESRARKIMDKLKDNLLNDSNLDMQISILS